MRQITHPLSLHKEQQLDSYLQAKIGLRAMSPFKKFQQHSDQNPEDIAAMSTIAKLWKEPRCPSKDEWIFQFLTECIFKVLIIRKTTFKKILYLWAMMNFN